MVTDHRPVRTKNYPFLEKTTLTKLIKNSNLKYPPL